jgi:hypothetical protein
MDPTGDYHRPGTDGVRSVLKIADAEKAGSVERLSRLFLGFDLSSALFENSHGLVN